MSTGKIESPKQKKITFKYFFDDRIKPKEGKFYPLYLQITFNRKNIQLKEVTHDGLAIYWTKEELEDFNDGNYNRHGHFGGTAQEVKFNENILERIIREGYKKHGDKFSLKSIKDKLKFFRTSVAQAMEQAILADLKTYLADNLTYSEFISVFDETDLLETLHRLKSARKNRKEILEPSIQAKLRAFNAIFLFSLPYSDRDTDMTFGSLFYHWIYGNHKEKFRSFLKAYFEKSDGVDFQYIQKELSYPPNKLQKELIEEFPPEQSEIGNYTELIDNQLSVLK